MLPVLIDLANSKIDLASLKVSKAGRPRVMFSTHPSIEVTKQDNVFVAGNVLDDNA